jgi:crotonobetainyl-CoA:carnitine CoA-transferase CaiB-like acyl-CoA transferase
MQPGTPFLVDGERPVTAPAPLIGQHNDEIFRGELGLHEREIERLATEGII